MKLTDKEYLAWKIALLESELDAIDQLLENEKNLDDVDKNKIEVEITLIKRWIGELS